MVTEAAPTYSPDRRCLIATSLVHGAGTTGTDVGENSLKRHLARIYGTSTDSWERLAQ